MTNYLISFNSIQNKESNPKSVEYASTVLSDRVLVVLFAADHPTTTRDLSLIKSSSSSLEKASTFSSKRLAADNYSHRSRNDG